MTVREVIEEFVSKRSLYSGQKPATVKNLLLGKDSDSDFMCTIEGMLDQSIISNEEYAYCVKTAVSSYEHSKKSAIEIFRLLQGYLNRKLELELDIEFPPIDISNSFERQMFIAKYLQNPTHLVSELEDVLWTSTRTINSDLTKLSGDDGDPIQIDGKPFIISEATHRNDRMQFASTAHPFFLTSNLTQVITVLKGLKEMCKDRRYEGYARPMAQEIWRQLSDYAKERIKHVLGDIIPEDLKWYEGLEDVDEQEIINTFLTEYDCSRKDVFMDCLKNGKKCCVEYKDGEKTAILEDVKARVCTDGLELMDRNGKLIRLSYDDIIRSSYTVEGLL